MFTAKEKDRIIFGFEEINNYISDNTKARLGLFKMEISKDFIIKLNNSILVKYLSRIKSIRAHAYIRTLLKEYDQYDLL